MINYISYQYGAAKGTTKDGDMFASSLNMGAADQNYSSAAVDNELLGTHGTGVTTFSTNVQWTPVIPGSVYVAAGAVTAADHDLAGNVNTITGGVGTITGTGVSGTVNYNTGLVSLTFTTAPDTDPTASYTYNNGDVSVNPSTKIPEVKLQITSMPVVAVSRKMKAVYAFDAAYELQKEYGQDIDTLLATEVSGEIAHKKFVA
jgi:hypothetical protein